MVGIHVYTVIVLLKSQKLKTKVHVYNSSCCIAAKIVESYSDTGELVTVPGITDPSSRPDGEPGAEPTDSSTATEPPAEGSEENGEQVAGTKRPFEGM